MGPKSRLFKIAGLMGEKRLAPVLDRVFSFSEIQQAHRRLEQREQFGKVVLIPSS